MVERVNYFVENGKYTDYIQVSESKKRVIFEWNVGGLTDKKEVVKNKRNLDSSILEEMVNYIEQQEKANYLECKVGFYHYIQHLDSLFAKYDESEK